MTKIKEAVHKLIGYRRFIEKMAMTIPGYIFDAEPFDMAISALEKQEQDSNKCCETCKYKNLPVSENPCDECYFASDYEDYYEAEEEA